MSYIRFMNLKHKAPNQFGPIGTAPFPPGQAATCVRHYQDNAK